MGILWVSDTIWHWLIADVVYAILVYIYSANGAYGIGMRGLLGESSYEHTSRWIDIIIFSALIVILQLLLFGGVKITKCITKRFNSK